MIVYDFECQRCREVFEKEGRPSTQTTPCPSCGGEARKVFLKVLPFTRRDDKRKWGTSRISSSLKFLEKRRKKGGKKDGVQDSNQV